MKPLLLSHPARVKRFRARYLLFQLFSIVTAHFHLVLCRILVYDNGNTCSQCDRQTGNTTGQRGSTMSHSSLREHGSAECLPRVMQWALLLVYVQAHDQGHQPTLADAANRARKATLESIDSAEF